MLHRLQTFGIQAKIAKCAFPCYAVEYLGHCIDATGLHSLASMVEVVTEALEPQDLGELHSFCSNILK